MIGLDANYGRYQPVTELSLNPYFSLGAIDEDSSRDASWEDGQFVFRRAWRRAADGKRDATLVCIPSRSTRHLPSSIVWLTNTG